MSRPAKYLTRPRPSRPAALRPGRKAGPRSASRSRARPRAHARSGPRGFERPPPCAQPLDGLLVSASSFFRISRRGSEPRGRAGAGAGGSSGGSSSAATAASAATATASSSRGAGDGHGRGLVPEAVPGARARRPLRLELRVGVWLKVVAQTEGRRRSLLVSTPSATAATDPVVLEHGFLWAWGLWASASGAASAHALQARTAGLGVANGVFAAAHKRTRRKGESCSKRAGAALDSKTHSRRLYALRPRGCRNDAHSHTHTLARARLRSALGSVRPRQATCPKTWPCAASATTSRSHSGCERRSVSTQSGSAETPFGVTWRACCA